MLKIQNYKKYVNNVNNMIKYFGHILKIDLRCGSIWLAAKKTWFICLFLLLK